MCLLGATDLQLADFFGICEKTLNNWKGQDPEFLQSVKAGKVEADAAVAASLYERAIGGDTTAMIFWLKNRRSGRYRGSSAGRFFG